MAWTKADDELACKQGWSVFEAHGEWEIERIDEKEKFINDWEALGFVKGRASMGCKVAKKALRMDGKACAVEQPTQNRMKMKIYKN